MNFDSNNMNEHASAIIAAKQAIIAAKKSFEEAKEAAIAKLHESAIALLNIYADEQKFEAIDIDYAWGEEYDTTEEDHASKLKKLIKYLSNDAVTLLMLEVVDEVSTGLANDSRAWKNVSALEAGAHSETVANHERTTNQEVD